MIPFALMCGSRHYVFDSAWFANKQFVFLGLWRKWALFRDVFDSVAFATRQFIPNCFSRAGFRRGVEREISLQWEKPRRFGEAIGLIPYF
jgi:hypothetical protein